MSISLRRSMEQIAAAHIRDEVFDYGVKIVRQIPSRVAHEAYDTISIARRGNHIRICVNDQCHREVEAITVVSLDTARILLGILEREINNPLSEIVSAA